MNKIYFFKYSVVIGGFIVVFELVKRVFGKINWKFVVIMLFLVVVGIVNVVNIDILNVWVRDYFDFV